MSAMERHFTRDLGELPALVAMTTAFFDAEGLDHARRQVVDLCLEELFVNTVHYDTGCTEAVQVRLAPAPRHGVEVTLTAPGVDRFDPHDAPAVDPAAPAEARTPGGLGLYLVMRMVDAIHYDYRDHTSRITFVAGSDPADDGAAQSATTATADQTEQSG